MMSALEVGSVHIANALWLSSYDVAGLRMAAGGCKGLRNQAAWWVKGMKESSGGIHVLLLLHWRPSGWAPQPQEKICRCSVTL